MGIVYAVHCTNFHTCMYISIKIYILRGVFPKLRRGGQMGDREGGGKFSDDPIFFLIFGLRLAIFKRQ